MGSSIHLMTTTGSSLWPLFRSTTQEQILAAVFVEVGRAYNMHELAAQIGKPYASVHREVQRLFEAGLIRKEKVGQASVLHPDTASPAYEALRDLLVVACGAVPLLRDALASIEGVEAAAIFGSYAARLRGESGPLPQDIDVLVLGEPDPMVVFAAVRDPSQALRLPVNPTVMTRPEWAEKTAFTEQVRLGLLVPVLGTVNAGAGR